jgi:hypothetical protein
MIMNGPIQTDQSDEPVADEQRMQVQAVTTVSGLGLRSQFGVRAMEFVLIFSGRMT